MSDFERLLYGLLSSTDGYENVERLMHATAVDRGRDVSGYQIPRDKLSGTFRLRVIVQCKHWIAKSIGVADVATLREQMRLWDPPRVAVLVIATSGRFTSDPVQYVEKHNQTDAALRIEMCPESHPESLLAARPDLIAEFGLRG
jgi:hypothetical protein